MVQIDGAREQVGVFKIFTETAVDGYGRPY